jgi:hypothetical protein
MSHEEKIKSLEGTIDALKKNINLLKNERDIKAASEVVARKMLSDMINGSLNIQAALKLEQDKSLSLLKQNEGKDKLIEKLKEKLETKNSGSQEPELTK